MSGLLLQVNYSSCIIFIPASLMSYRVDSLGNLAHYEASTRIKLSSSHLCVSCSCKSREITTELAYNLSMGILRKLKSLLHFTTDSRRTL